MTLTQLFRSTQGTAPDGFSLVYTLTDDTRHLDFYRDAQPSKGTTP